MYIPCVANQDLIIVTRWDFGMCCSLLMCPKWTFLRTYANEWEITRYTRSCFLGLIDLQKIEDQRCYHMGIVSSQESSGRSRFRLKIPQKRSWWWLVTVGKGDNPKIYTLWYTPPKNWHTLSPPKKWCLFCFFNLISNISSYHPSEFGWRRRPQQQQQQQQQQPLGTHERHATRRCRGTAPEARYGHAAALVGGRVVGEHSDGNRCEWKGNERFGAGGLHSGELRYLAGKKWKMGAPDWRWIWWMYLLLWWYSSQLMWSFTRGYLKSKIPSERERLERSYPLGCVFGGKIPWRLLKRDTSWI